MSHTTSGRRFRDTMDCQRLIRLRFVSSNVSRVSRASVPYEPWSGTTCLTSPLATSSTTSPRTARSRIAAAIVATFDS